MNKMSQDELAIAAMYEADSPKESIAKMTESLPYIEDPGMLNLVQGTIEKLEKITGADYKALDFSAYQNLFKEETDNE